MVSNAIWIYYVHLRVFLAYQIDKYTILRRTILYNSFELDYTSMGKASSSNGINIIFEYCVFKADKNALTLWRK